MGYSSGRKHLTRPSSLSRWKWCGTLQTTLALALNAMLNVVPIDLAGRAAAARIAIRLYARQSSKKNIRVPTDSDRPLCTPILGLETSFTTYISARENWEGCSIYNRRPVHLFTDSSQLNGKIDGAPSVK